MLSSLYLSRITHCFGKARLHVDLDRGDRASAVPASLIVLPFDTIEDHVPPWLPLSRSRERGTDICPEAARQMSILGHEGFRRLRLA